MMNFLTLMPLYLPQNMVASSTAAAAAANLFSDDECYPAS